MQFLKSCLIFGPKSRTEVYATELPKKKKIGTIGTVHVFSGSSYAPCYNQNWESKDNPFNLRAPPEISIFGPLEFSRIISISRTLNFQDRFSIDFAQSKFFSINSIFFWESFLSILPSVKVSSIYKCSFDRFLSRLDNFFSRFTLLSRSYLLIDM